MHSENSTDRYEQNPIERVAAVAVAVAVVILAGYLIVRNEPFADPSLVVITRIILSLAVAVLGATIPGFLSIGWKKGGMVIRAGGALALFVLTYWLTPAVVPSLKDTTIPPLTNPKELPVPNSTSQRSTLILTSGLGRFDAQTAGLSVRAVYEGDGTPQRKYYDIVISNSDTAQRILKAFKLKWLYAKGATQSLEQGLSLKPVERYSVGIPVDPDKSYQIFEKAEVVYPPLLLPARTSSGPSVTSIRLEVFYSFDGTRINWHPSSAWDIYYEVSLQDDSGNSSRAISGSWRRGSAPNWIENFTRKKESTPPASS